MLVLLSLPLALEGSKGRQRWVPARGEPCICCGGALMQGGPVLPKGWAAPCTWGMKLGQAVVVGGGSLEV